MFQVAIMAVGLAAASRASAQLVLDSVGTPGQNNYQTVTLVSTQLGINQSGVEAGFYNLTYNGVNIPAFCIDIARDESEGPPGYTGYSTTTLASAPFGPSGPMGSAAATKIEEMWTKYYSLAASSSVDAAALQVAIWEEVALGNGTYTLTVSGNSAVTTEATTMLGSPGTATTGLIAVVDTQTTGQAYSFPVPEPSTMISGALLLLPFGASTLRILRRNRAA